jgi:hypothetical protein
VAVFKDLFAIIQGQLLDIVTDPSSDGSGLEEVSQFADFITAKTVEVTSRSVRHSRESTAKSEADLGVRVSPTSVGLDAKVSGGTGSSSEEEVSYSEALRETIVFSELYQVLDKALAAVQTENPQPDLPGVRAARTRYEAGLGGGSGSGGQQRDRGPGWRVLYGQDPDLLGSAAAAA